jgi:hypothetical protein
LTNLQDLMTRYNVALDYGTDKAFLVMANKLISHISLMGEGRENDDVGRGEQHGGPGEKVGSRSDELGRTDKAD